MVTPGAAPARLGRYELLARIATGGMGEIFLARLEGAAGFEKLFVIKRILPHLADDERFRAMLIAEAQIASIMTHANICHVYELGETDGQLYIVMEYLEGSTMLPLLRRRAKEGNPLDLGFIGGVIQQATDGLHYAHELKDRSGEYLGIVHRDVTPANIFLTDAGVVKVLDFGIAKVKNASAHTQTGTVKGKYAYMAPEQLRGAAIDRRADVFALGVVLYEMLALRRLFQRKTDYLTFRAVLEQPIKDVRDYRPDCPPSLANAVSRALDRDPDNRFATARVFGSAVLDAIGAFRRPWTHGELSDFASSQFADEIGQRSAQIATVVQPGSRHTMPLLVQSDDETIEIEDDDDDFASVESGVSHRPPIVEVQGPSGEHRALLDPGASAPKLDELRGVPGMTAPQPVVVVSPRRSLIWPLVAFAMVAVAGGALYLVWYQMQNQPPTAVNITTDGTGRITRSGPKTLVIEPEPDSPAPPSATPPPPHRALPTQLPERKLPTGADYHRVVRSAQGELTRCTRAHGNPSRGAKVVISVAPDGRVKSVTMAPEELDDSPLASCIKNVLKAKTFPRDRDYQFEVELLRPV